MAKAKYYLSFAYQETFGYTLQEAIHFRCKIAVPNRACYPEMVNKEALFENLDVKFADVPMEYTERWDKNKYEIINHIRNANR
jgi:hypothetical protein